MRTEKLILLAAIASVSMATNQVMARTLTSTCSGDIENCTTWGIDPKQWTPLSEEDVLVVNHELEIYTKYGDITIGNLTINEGAKLLIKYGGDDYYSFRSLEVHGNLINYGCLGFDKLGNFSNLHDEAIVNGYGRLWLSVWGNVENYGTINTNNLSLMGKDPTILSTKPMQISEFLIKYAKGTTRALSDLSFYNSSLTFWAGAVEDTESRGLDMGNYTLTVTADAPREPDVWWYSPVWYGELTDMNIKFGDKGKLVINNCFARGNTISAGHLTISSESYAFLLGHNDIVGDVDFASGNIQVCANNWVDALNIKGNVVNHANLNASPVTFPDRGIGGKTYNMENIGDDRVRMGFVNVYGNIENLGTFGTSARVIDGYNEVTTLRMITLGKEISIKGEYTGDVVCAQVEPRDEYDGVYSEKTLAKKGAVVVNGSLRVNRNGLTLNTTMRIPEGAVCEVNPDLSIDDYRIQCEPITIDDYYINESYGCQNGKLVNEGTLTCTWGSIKNSDVMQKVQHVSFPEYARWIFDGNEEYWQIDDRLDYVRIVEKAKSLGNGTVKRIWSIEDHGQGYKSIKHDIALSYEDSWLNGAKENKLDVYQSQDGEKSWKKVSQAGNCTIDTGKNIVTIGSWEDPASSFITGFGSFTLAETSLSNGITAVKSDESQSNNRYDLMGRQIEAGRDAHGLIIENGSKVIR